MTFAMQSLKIISHAINVKKSYSRVQMNEVFIPPKIKTNIYSSIYVVIPIVGTK